ncbi:MAG: NAD(P)-binding protein [Candidatus Bipolaricaulota bacterium]|nr:NAD(P)-binding protein [Candidatus Bipolaricaulota bacterium]MCS7274726.1 NAD(P)-binding protein [Candidatus Bipolaricaulota bacterium]MDW8110004.1 NAD(P)-binding protein [Candidatus Bipolaricaulota bacterium]MDW8328924.1 NAD(P)-binding protein [Candidatus Bipolaricaulota bacterium]
MGRAITFRSVAEMPPLAISLDDISHNKTGSWRYLRPVYRNKIPPCRAGCPAGNDIPRWLALVAEGRLTEAWKTIRENNPFPGITGRVCAHPCEAYCNRKEFDEPIAIAALERHVADEAFALHDEPPSGERRREKIAIVGSGPAGLSCAYFLAKQNYPVTIYEAESQPGGMLRLGIPSYRLPRDVIDKEIDDIVRLGVEIKTGYRVGRDIDLERLWASYDALFIATGAYRSRPLGIPGEELPGVLAGLDVLKAINTGRKISLGERVLVIGGGNTAMDAARTALRLGARVTVIYRRTRAEMPAIPEEIAQAEAEGVEFLFLAAPQKIERVHGRLRVHLIRMQLGEPDKSGRRRPVPLPNSEFVLEADALLKAIGEDPDLDFLAEELETSEGIVIHNERGRLSRAGIFLGGDARTGPSTVVEAIADGKAASKAIQRYLRSPSRTASALLPERFAPEKIKLNTSYFAHQARVPVLELPPEERQHGFAEVKAPLWLEDAIVEAQRCFSCGVCNACDNCRVFCPDVAISRVNGLYHVNLEYCKGCGICAAECPRGCIDLIEEGR